MAKKPKDPGASAADQMQTQVSEWRLSHYDKNFVPIENEMVRRSEFTAGERNRVTGNVAADTAAAFKDLNRKTVSASGQAGEKIGSGSTLMALAGNAEAQGGTQGVGRAAAALGGRLQSEMEQFRAAQTGENIVSNIQTNLAQAAQRQTMVANQKAYLKAQAQNQKIAAAGAVLGAGVAKGMHMKEAKALAAEEQKGLKAALDWEGVELPPISVTGKTGLEGALDWQMPKLPTIGGN